MNNQLLIGGVIGSVLWLLGPVASSGWEYVQTGARVYTIPDTDPNAPHMTALYSYRHDARGQRMPNADAGNVVRTSQGRIFAVALCSNLHGNTVVDGYVVTELTMKPGYFVCKALDDFEWHTAYGQGGRALYRCRLSSRPSGHFVEVVPLPESTRGWGDAFSVSLNDLYRWRAEKARQGGSEAWLGFRIYKVIPTMATDRNSTGWLFFDAQELDRSVLVNDHLIRPRYFAPTSEKLAGNWVTITRPVPIGDSGYLLVHNAGSGRFEYRPASELASPEGGSIPSLGDILKELSEDR